MRSLSSVYHPASSAQVAILLLFFCTMGSFAQNQGFSLHGQVFDSQTKAPIANASIYLNESFTGTTTNTKGNYEIQITSTPAVLVISCIGYTRRYFTLTHSIPEGLDVPLDPSLNEIPEVVITAKRIPMSISDEQDMYVTDSELREINIKTGQLTPQIIKIPDFPFISKLMVNDGFLFFLYEEKIYPNFMRLYRMVI